MAVAGVVGAVDAVAVSKARDNTGDVAVPHEVVHLGQFDASFVVVVVEEAEFHPVCDPGEEREVGSGTVVGCAEGVGAAWPDLHE